MTRLIRRLRSKPQGIFLLALILGLVAWSASSHTRQEKSRSFKITQTFEVEFPDNPSNYKIWVPIPSTTPAQKVAGLTVQSPVPHQMTTDRDFGNRLLYFKGQKSEDKILKFVISYEIERREQNGLHKRNQGAVSLSPSEKNLYLEERGLVVFNKTVRERAAQVTSGKTQTLAKAQAIYNNVFDSMSYDKSGEGWGRGDVLYACDAAKGNCTDFHSLFIAMMRSVRIPARFKMGFPLTKEPQGRLTGYHCWAEFFDERQGWIPVDISEAWKNPKKKEYFFGRVNEDRFQISMGRETHLNPRQTGPALNWLLYPHVEVDGKPYDRITTQFKFTKI